MHFLAGILCNRCCVFPGGLYLAAQDALLPFLGHIDFDDLVNDLSIFSTVSSVFSLFVINRDFERDALKPCKHPTSYSAPFPILILNPLKILNVNNFS